MRNGQCEGCKHLTLLVTDYCEACEDKYGEPE